MRVAEGREPSPSEAAVDSQSGETATMIHQDVGNESTARRVPLMVGLLTRMSGLTVIRACQFILKALLVIVLAARSLFVSVQLQKTRFCCV